MGISQQYSTSSTVAPKKKNSPARVNRGVNCQWLRGRIRTCDLQVMSLTGFDPSRFGDFSYPPCLDETNDKNPTTFGMVRGNLEIEFWI